MLLFSVAVLSVIYAIDAAGTSQDRGQRNLMRSEAGEGTVSTAAVQGSALLRLAPSAITADSIPKVIHFVWKTKQPEKGKWPIQLWEDCFDMWHKYFPETEYQYIFWDDDKAAKFVATDFPQHNDYYQKLERGIVRADFIRLCILSSHGGIYADLDYEPRANFYNLLVPGKVNVVASPYKVEKVQNSLMASPPGQEFWTRAMKLASDAHHSVSSTDVVASAGPVLLDQLNASTSSDVHVLPCAQFQPGIHEGDMDPSRGCPKLKTEDIGNGNIKGIHWGTWLWLKGDGNEDTKRVYKSFHGKPATYFGFEQSTQTSGPIEAHLGQ